MILHDSVDGARRAVLGIVCVLLALVASAATMRAQLPTPDEMEAVAGRTFIVAFPDTTINEHDHEFVTHSVDDQILICIYSAVENTISITGPSGYNKPNIVLPANQFTIIDLMRPEWRSAYPISWQVGKVTASTFRIVAQQPIVTYCMMITEFGAEAWTPMPVEKWGTEYYAAARDGEVVYDVIKGPDGYNKLAKPAPGLFTIIAAFDGTSVSFHTGERLADDYPRSVTLNAGQTYTIQSYVDLAAASFGDVQPDLGGTRIVGSKPIAVISGNTRAQVLTEGEGLTQNPWKNMLIEWMPPVEQHGTEFIFMPTWDARRPAGEYISYKRNAEFVRLYATRPGQTEGFYTTGEVNADVFIDPFVQGTVSEFRFATVPPRYFRTNQPAMAMMNSAAAVRYNGLFPVDIKPDDPDPKEPPEEPDTTITLTRDFEGWGAYMVEMVPREQWTTFAPYWAPTLPAAMENFINVVTDSANRGHILREDGTPFFFNRGEIPNTGLVWGTMTVPSGTTHWLRSDNGGKFYAYSYGVYRGTEQYLFIPKNPPRPNEPPGEGRFEHREYFAWAYGYPLAPRRNFLRRIDTLDIQPTLGCTDLTVVVNATNANTSGIRVIKLEPATNARIKSIMPFEYVASPSATVVVEPIDKRQNASGTIVLITRSGQEFTVPYNYIAESVRFAPSGMLDLGEQTVNATAQGGITVMNPVAKSIDVRSVRLRAGNQDFRIVSTSIALPTTLATDGAFVVTIEGTPRTPGRLYIDSLVIETACSTFTYPLRMETVQPFISVDNLNFGNVTLSRQKDLDLPICNIGRGVVTFHDSLGNDVISWGDANFIVSDADKNKLRNMRLGPDQCDTIKVRFQANTTGIFRTTARLIANTRLVRDTSVWTATVRIPGPQLDGVDFGPQWLTSGDPCSKNTLNAYSDSIVVFNTGSSDFDVTSLTISGPDVDAGFFELDRSDPGATAEGKRVRAVGTDTSFVYQRILFKPTEERAGDYTAKVTMVVTNPVTGIQNTVENTITGRGVQSHVSIGDYTFDTVQFAGAGSTMVPGQITFEVKPTRATTITDVQIVPNNGEFVVTNLAALQRTWQPGETGVVQLEFRPSVPELRNARLVIVGDQSRCDDSESALAGFTRRRPIDPPPPPPPADDTLGVAVSDVSFGAVAGCHDTTIALAVRNTGTAPVIVTGFTLVDGGPEFSVDAVGTPVTIAAGASASFNVHFAPGTSAPYIGHARFDLLFASNDSVAARTVTLSASGVDVVATASIGTDYTALAGEHIDIPIMLGSSLAGSSVSDLAFTLRYQRGMMFADVGDPSRLVKGTLLNGWSAQVTSHQPDASDPRVMELSLRATAPAGISVNGPGELVRVPFRMLIGDTMATSLPFTMSSASSRCVQFTTTPGSAHLDSICGLSFRAIAATGTTYALRQNAPNPFNPSTTIEFSIGLDGPTKLVVFDASGRRVATLVDATLNPGSYSVVWDASAMPSGLYYYRLTNGTWSKTNAMMLQK